MPRSRADDEKKKKKKKTLSELIMRLRYHNFNWGRLEAFSYGNVKDRDLDLEMPIH